MIPRRPSLPSTISRTLGPVDVLGTGRSASGPRRRDHAQPARQVGHVAVLVGLHARRAGRDPAAERRVREAVGEVPERPAARVELRLERRAEHARLHPREARHRVDLQHAVQPAEVDASTGARLVRRARRGCRRCSCRRRTGSRPRRPRARRRAPPRPPPRSPGRTTDVGQPAERRRARWRTRSRRLLPRPWTTRSSGSSETDPVPTASSSAARSTGGQRRLGHAERVERDRARGRPPHVEPDASP